MGSQFTPTRATDHGSKAMSKLRTPLAVVALMLAPSAPLLGRSMQQDPGGGGESPRITVRAGFSYQDFSFASNAQGATILLNVERPRDWSVWTGFDYVNKFDDSAPGFRMGGSYWAGGSTVLTLNIAAAPDQIVVPRQAYTIEVSRAMSGRLASALSYRFADYATANTHMIMPEVTWYFPRLYWLVRYYLAVSAFGGQNTTTHSALTRAHWNVTDPVTLSAGYVRANESFESGNPADPFAGFSANHLLMGVDWDIRSTVGVGASIDYEARNDGSTVWRYDIRTFYRW
jgi:YaiO family outer membrane protein